MVEDNRIPVEIMSQGESYFEMFQSKTILTYQWIPKQQITNQVHHYQNQTSNPDTVNVSEKGCIFIV